MNFLWNILACLLCNSPSDTPYQPERESEQASYCGLPWSGIALGVSGLDSTARRNPPPWETRPKLAQLLDANQHYAFSLLRAAGPRAHKVVSWRGHVHRALATGRRFLASRRVPFGSGLF